MMDDTRGNVGKNVDFEKIDNCSEVALGVFCTFALTLVMWLVALPFFDVAGFNWMRSWERVPGQISLAHFKENLLYDYPASGEAGIPAGAFEIMDSNHDGYVVFDEYDHFMGSLTNPMNGTTASYTFKGLDADKDEVLTPNEFTNGLSQPEFYYFQTTTTTTETQADFAPAPAPEQPAAAATVITDQPEGAAIENTAPPTGPPSVVNGDISMEQLQTMMGDLGSAEELTAFQAFDLDKDSFAAKGEFLEGLKQIQQPITGSAAEGVFQNLDVNKDNMVGSDEFFKAFQAGHYVSIAPPQATTTSAPPNPLKVKALQDLGLSAEPLSLSAFTARLGAMTPQEAFNSLDADQDEEISEDEMVQGGKAFAQPLSEIEAKYAWRGLDVTGEGKVVYPEMADTMSFGNFFPTHDQAVAARAAR